MFEIINWIIFGLFTIALIADSAYALYCLLKIKINFVLAKLMIVLLFLFLNVLCLLVFTLEFIPVKSHPLSASSLVFTFMLNSIILLMVIIFNHGCPIGVYQWQLNESKSIVKQQSIKL